MAIANNDVKAAKTAVTLLRKKPAKPAARNQQAEAYPGAYGQMAESAMLEFDRQFDQDRTPRRKVGAFDAACLNGTSLAFKGGKTLLVLLWKNADLKCECFTRQPRPAGDDDAGDAWHARNGRRPARSDAHPAAGVTECFL